MFYKQSLFQQDLFLHNVNFFIIKLKFISINILILD